MSKLLLSRSKAAYKPLASRLEAVAEAGAGGAQRHCQTDCVERRLGVEIVCRQAVKELCRAWHTFAQRSGYKQSAKGDAWFSATQRCQQQLQQQRDWKPNRPQARAGCSPSAKSKVHRRRNQLRAPRRSQPKTTFDSPAHDIAARSSRNQRVRERRHSKTNRNEANRSRASQDGECFKTAPQIAPRSTNEHRTGTNRSRCPVFGEVCPESDSTGIDASFEASVFILKGESLEQ
jgi:hypothetical protein